MTDDGSENKAEVDEYLKDTKIDHFIAQKDVFYSNSMVESSFCKLKYQFLFTRNLADFNETYRYMETVISECGNRPLSALYGLTPNEVMNGAMPDKNMFNPQKQLAKSIRVMENKQCIECQ